MCLSLHLDKTPKQQERNTSRQGMDTVLEAGKWMNDICKEQGGCKLSWRERCLLGQTRKGLVLGGTRYHWRQGWRIRLNSPDTLYGKELHLHSPSSSLCPETNPHGCLVKMTWGSVPSCKVPFGVGGNGIRERRQSLSTLFLAIYSGT